jgi:hypothetical protein
MRQYLMRTRFMAGVLLAVLLAGMCPSFAQQSQTPAEFSSHGLAVPAPAGIVRLGTDKRQTSLIRPTQPAIVSSVFVAPHGGIETCTQNSAASFKSSGARWSVSPRAPPA